MASPKEIRIHKTWRSELGGAIAFLLLCIATVYLSNKIPASVIRGEIWRGDDYRVYLKLPLFWLLPAGFFAMVVYRIYDVRYMMTPVGIEALAGVVSLRLVRTRVRYEDIRAVEVIQGVLDRLLDVGLLEISTSATGGVEILLEGVAAPRDVQEALLAERDRRQQISTKTFDSHSQSIVSNSRE